MNRHALLPVVLNNQIVNQLKDGRASAVDALVQFGVRPEWEIDEVGEQSSGTSRRRTAWGWAHQAERPDAVCAWWKWIHRYLEALPSDDASQFLDRCFTQALDAAVPLGRAAVLVETWGRTLEWAHRLPRWSRKAMMQRAAPVFAEMGDPGVPCLDALSEAGFIGSADWSLEARAGYPQDPLARALKDGQGALVEHLLKQGSPPVLQGRSALSAVLTGEINIGDGAAHHHILALLLRHGASWDVDLGLGQSCTAEGALCAALDENGPDPMVLRPLSPELAAIVAQRRLQSRLHTAAPRSPRRARL